MEFKSIVSGLDEAIKISKGEIVGRRQKRSVSPIQSFSNIEIKELRHQLKVTQSTFAEILGVTPKTVEAWEKGTNVPSGPARRMIEILKVDSEALKRYHIVE